MEPVKYKPIPPNKKKIELMIDWNPGHEEQRANDDDRGKSRTVDGRKRKERIQKKPLPSRRIRREEKQERRRGYQRCRITAIILAANLTFLHRFNPDKIREGVLDLNRGPREQGSPTEEKKRQD